MCHGNMGYAEPGMAGAYPGYMEGNAAKVCCGAPLETVESLTSRSIGRDAKKVGAEGFSFCHFPVGDEDILVLGTMRPPAVTLTWVGDTTAL